MPIMRWGEVRVGFQVLLLSNNINDNVDATNTIALKDVNDNNDNDNDNDDNDNGNDNIIKEEKQDDDVEELSHVPKRDPSVDNKIKELEEEILRLQTALNRKTNITKERNNKTIWKNDEEYQFSALIRAHYQSGKDVAKDACRMTFKGKNWAKDMMQNSELFKGARETLQKSIMFYLDQNFIDGYLYLGFIDRKFMICDDPTSEMYGKEDDREAAFIILETLCLKLLNVSVKKSKMHHVIKINKARVKECPDFDVYFTMRLHFSPNRRSRPSLR